MSGRGAADVSSRASILAMSRANSNDSFAHGSSAIMEDDIEGVEAAAWEEEQQLDKQVKIKGKKFPIFIIFSQTSKNPEPNHCPGLHTFLHWICRLHRPPPLHSSKGYWHQSAKIVTNHRTQLWTKAAIPYSNSIQSMRTDGKFHFFRP